MSIELNHVGTKHTAIIKFSSLPKYIHELTAIFSETFAKFTNMIQQFFSGPKKTLAQRITVIKPEDPKILKVMLVYYISMREKGEGLCDRHLEKKVHRATNNPLDSKNPKSHKAPEDPYLCNPSRYPEREKKSPPFATNFSSSKKESLYDEKVKREKAEVMNFIREKVPGASDKNDYSILGLRTGESLDKVKKAYREKIRLFHPDREKDPRAVAAFQRIQLAYDNILIKQQGKENESPKPAEPNRSNAATEGNSEALVLA